MIWAMIISVTVGDQVTRWAMPYGSLRACEAERYAVEQYLDAQTWCAIIPARFVSFPPVTFSVKELKK